MRTLCMGLHTQIFQMRTLCMCLHTHVLAGHSGNIVLDYEFCFMVRLLGI